MRVGNQATLQELAERIDQAAACLNREAAHRPEHLRERSLYLQGDLAETLAALRQVRSIAATIK